MWLNSGFILYQIWSFGCTTHTESERATIKLNESAMLKKCLVVGNCQVKSLAHTLNYYSEDTSFEHFQVHTLPSDRAEEIIREKVEASKGKYDIILSFRLSDK